MEGSDYNALKAAEQAVSALLKAETQNVVQEQESEQKALGSLREAMQSAEGRVVEYDPSDEGGGGMGKH
jgi:conjugal transfer/entry exclusion protein